jgi:hypothetical protein
MRAMGSDSAVELTVEVGFNLLKSVKIAVSLFTCPISTKM